MKVVKFDTNAVGLYSSMHLFIGVLLPKQKQLCEQQLLRSWFSVCVLAITVNRDAFCCGAALLSKPIQLLHRELNIHTYTLSSFNLKAFADIDNQLNFNCIISI